ncbi:MAG: hypothetical protein B7733_07095 [Myxococcales bacterium FL481]|nr:MAG: hypothetical protein B7733_07095 [Myxococcales bacterium FL481]
MGTYVTLPGDLTNFRESLELDVNSEPTLTQADAQLLLYEAELELACIYRGYTVPIDSDDSPRSFKTCQLAVLRIMAHYVEVNRGELVEVSSTAEDQEGHEDAWAEFLNNVRTIPNYLADAERSSTGDATDQQGRFQSNFSETSAHRDVRVFKRSEWKA